LWMLCDNVGMKAVARFLGVCLLFGALLLALTSLLILAIWGLANGQFWLGIGSLAILAVWFRFAMLNRNPDNPKDFKDFGA
jgi:hypothetical protein